MPEKMLDRPYAKTNGKPRVISARAAADQIPLSDNTFLKALEAKIIHPQARIEGDPKPSYGFVPEYIKEIAKVIPSGRSGGQRVFTSEVIEKIQKINEKWDKLYPLR